MSHPDGHSASGDVWQPTTVTKKFSFDLRRDGVGLFVLLNSWGDSDRILPILTVPKT